MGDAYTPGLTVTAETTVRKLRRLPLSGDVVVRVGMPVAATDIVARTELPGRVHLVNFANKLGVLPDEVEQTLRLQPGSDIKPQMLMAEHRSFFGLFRQTIEAPIAGTFESVSKVTGMAVLREPPVPVEVTAYLDGEVVEELPREGVVVEARAAMVQGIFGLAGEVHAPLTMVAERPEQPLEAGDLGPHHAGKVVVGGGRVTLAALRRALELEVAAVVVGGIAYQDVKEILGYDVGVAVTGTEPLATTLVVTEGFGDIAMARATFDLLARFEGQEASVNGATQIRAGVIRPEVVIPTGQKSGATGRDAAASPGLDVGVDVRCIRAPYFGRIGKVTALPVELRTMPSETRVRVLEVALEDGDRVIVPRANVEVIEQ